MPQRIPDNVIERLKQSISVERLAEARGVELKRHGTDEARPSIKLWKKHASDMR